MMYIKQGKHVSRIGKEVNEAGRIMGTSVSLHNEMVATLKSQDDLKGFIKGLPLVQLGAEVDGVPDHSKAHGYTYISQWNGVEVVAIFYVKGDKVTITECSDGDLSALITVTGTFSELEAALKAL